MVFCYCYMPTDVENTPELEEAVSDEEDDDNNYPACAGSKYWLTPHVWKCIHKKLLAEFLLFS